MTDLPSGTYSMSEFKRIMEGLLGVIAVEDFVPVGAPDDPEHPHCIGCGKSPEELEEYIEEAKFENMTPTEFVFEEEGTLNTSNGHFACSHCYIQLGQPSSRLGWKAP